MAPKASPLVLDRASPLPLEELSGDLAPAVRTWLDDGKAAGWQSKTLKARRQMLDHVMWWLTHIARIPPDLASLTPARVRSFLAYVREPQPDGRWGSNHHSGYRETKPSTVKTYHCHIRAFLNFCLAEGLLTEKPLKNVKVPRVPRRHIQPFDKEQLEALLTAARRGSYPDRDVAIILLLLDTGMRVSELCWLTVGSIDRGSGELTVIGKGNKKRTVYMGVNARRSVWRYMEAERRECQPEEPLVVSVGGHTAGAGMTPSGVYQVIRDHGATAAIKGVRCSPHTLRHTFAVNFLRSGGNLFELQQLMGHEDLTVLRDYVYLAEADLATANRTHSPADRMKLR